MEFRDERGSARNSSMIDSHTQFSGRHSFAIFRPLNLKLLER